MHMTKLNEILTVVYETTQKILYIFINYNNLSIITLLENRFFGLFEII